MKPLFFLITFTLSAIAADDLPAWLRTAAAEKLPSYDSKTPAVALLRESNVSVDESGRIVTTDRVAIKVLNRAGIRSAGAAKVYLRDTGKVRDVKAWVINPSGDARKLGKERILDLAAGEDALYEDIRARVIQGEKDCDPGSVFGYESVIEEKSIFTQLDWEFSDRLPARVSRFALTLPSGWSAKAVTLNHEDIKSVENGGTQTWELRELPWFEAEPASPSFESLRPRLAISIFPGGNGGSNLGPSFARWQDVSAWLSALHDPQSEPDDAIRAKVKDLTANAKDDAAKIRALATYVQGIRYVSIQTGVGRGGGFKPHPAALVFAKSYGDCKDKANLLRAMLRAAGIQSFPVSIFSGDPLYVREDWPTPQQFNHCILAIVAPAGMEGDATVEDPKLGKLLIFDPTDSYTPLGYMPVHEQNSLALIVAGEKGSLLRMPSARADANKTFRTIEASVAADGSVKGAMHEELTGWTATLQRAARKQDGEQNYQKRVETRITNRLRSAAISHLNTTDTPADGRFQIELEFSSSGFAQLMQRRLLVFRPSVLDPVDPLPFTEARRNYPAVITARVWRDSVKVKLPEGFDVDELPDAVKIETPFGVYETKSVVSDGNLTYIRSLSLKSIVVPPEDYPKLKAFSDQVGGADQAPIVLAKK